MKIAIIGYGKMGREIESILKSKNIDEYCIANNTDEIESIPSEYNVAIDFTTSDAFLKNYQLLADKFEVVVTGTTGWYENLEIIKKIFNARNKTFIYGTNFSIGANLFFNIAEMASKLFSFNDEYEPYIIEYHHKHKLDSPSGTAKTLSEFFNNEYKQINIQSVRAGNIKGIHEIHFDSGNDEIVLKHIAKTRGAFAEGALLAAKWGMEIKGVFEFKELFNKKYIQKI